MSSPEFFDASANEPLLPPPPPPAANYLPVREADGLLFVAGQTPHIAGELPIRGRVGAEVCPEEAKQLARRAALNALSALGDHLGGLENIARILTVTGYVAATPEFTAHPTVIDGASEVLIECLGEAGRHSRAAVGVASLPDGAPVEVSVIAQRRVPHSAEAAPGAARPLQD